MSDRLGKFTSWYGLMPSIAALLLLAGASVARAEKVACRYTYGGETKVITAFPVKSPYLVTATRVGSYFLFRIVFQNEPVETASIKIYTYVDRDEGPALIHSANFPYPPNNPAAAPYGFSGLHFVYEPVRDSELQYWCDMQAEPVAER